MSSSSLPSLGWDDLRAAELARLPSFVVPGRVVRVDRGAAVVVTPDNPVHVETRGFEPLAVGDWVALSADSDRWNVHSLLARRGVVRRAVAGPQSRDQLLAANVDVVIVAVPTVPEPKLGMAERLLALAWDSGATPLVVLTKADLVGDPDDVAAELRDSAPGVDVVVGSATAAGGYDEVAARLTTGRTCCLVGRSGAGKSTLANALLGVDHFLTTGVRADGKGRHTTTFRELVVLPGGGVLIDTPGLRAVGLFDAADGLDRVFADVEELVAQCRFADCGHDSEPGCAVLAAVDDGTLPERRLASWRKLQREAQWMARRVDARLRAEQARQWKARSRQLRRDGHRARP